MSSELATVHQEIFKTENSLSFGPNATPELVEASCQFFAGIRESTKWYIGDAVLYAEARWGDEVAVQVLPTGIAPDALYQWIRVAKEFPAIHRKQGMSWDFHRRLCVVPPPLRYEIADQAWREGWTQAKLDDVVGPWKDPTKGRPKTKATVVKDMPETGAERVVELLDRRELLRFVDWLAKVAYDRYEETCFEKIGHIAEAALEQSQAR